MKIKLIFFFLFVLIGELNAQDIVILDSETKEILPYVTILNTKNKKGFYTNEKGIFSLIKKENDSISILHLGYKTLELKVSEIKDSIFLKHNTKVLKEVKIKTKKAKDKTIGYIKKSKTLSWDIEEKTELATLIKYKKKYKSAYIKKIYLPIGKMKLVPIKNTIKETYPDFNSIFRIHIYSNLNGRPKIDLLEKPFIVECNQSSPNIIEIDVSNEFIKLPKKGVFISVEMIGELDSKRNLLSKKNKSILPTFKFTNRKKNNLLSKTFVKTILDKGKWKTTETKNKLIKSFSKFNLAVSLKLSVYK